MKGEGVKMYRVSTPEQALGKTKKKTHSTPHPDTLVFQKHTKNATAVVVIAVVTAVFAVPYGLLLGAWPWLVRAVPSFERSRVRLAGALAVLALPAALYVGPETGRFAGAIRPREFTEAFLAAFVAGWVGLLTPRLVLKSLAPGNLIAKSVQAAV